MAPRTKKLDEQPDVDETPELEEAAPPARAFKLRDELVDGDGEPVNRISFGGSPYVSIGAGEVYTTSDQKLAERLASDSDFEETTA